MVSALSNFDNNLADGTHKLNVNMDMITKKLKRVELNTKIANAVLNIQTNVKYDLIEYKCYLKNKRKK